MTAIRSTKLTLWLALVALVTPFIWIKIGPQGLAFYGPDVPDIYILGATILGKDRSFPGIAFAIVFQLVIGACFILCSFVAHRRALQNVPVHLLATVQLLLLALFPFWLGLYVNGVIHNSDGAAADLRVYPHIGLLVYSLMVVLSINTFLRSAAGGLSQACFFLVRGFSVIQLTLLLLLPKCIQQKMERFADHAETTNGLSIYWCIGFVVYLLLLALTIKTILKGTTQVAHSSGST